MKPRFRFTLGGLQISDPIGWENIVLNLERDPKYHSLVENVDTPFEFWGRTASKDGGYARIKQARDNGPNSKVELLAQVSWNGGTSYDTFFSGQLDLTTLKDVKTRGKRTFQCGIIRNDLWSRFINRKSIPVDIQSPTDLDGNSISVCGIKTLTLTNQKIRQLYQGRNDNSYSYAIVGNFYGQIDFGIEDISEIEQKFLLPRVYNASLPTALFTMKFAGDYTFECEIFATDGATTQTTFLDVYFKINSNAAIAFTKAQEGANGVDGRTHFTYSDTHTLVKGDEIRIYFQNSNGATNTFEWSSSYDSYLNVVGNTEYEDTETEGFPIHDTGLSILNRIIGRENTFYSEYFGGQTATAIAYDDDGCGLNYLTMLGQHIRDYAVADKPYSQSFDEWWDSWNPIFCLGLGVEVIGTTEVIRVEKREDFYDDSSQSIILEGVNGIEISYDPDFFYTSVEAGYQKWSIESKSGTDDPQTVHTYGTLFKTVGTSDKKDFVMNSLAYAASLGIEQTRRQVLETSKDWAIDDNFVVIQSDLSTDPATPMLYDASVITNLYNAETRYNVRLTPASNIERAKKFLAIGFSSYTSDFFKFVRGEGNTAMQYNDPTATGCDAEAGTVAIENGDILIGPDFLFQPVLYTFAHPLTWNQYKGVRDNPKKSIAVRYVDNDGVSQQAIAFVKKLAYKPNESKADFQVWIKSLAPI